MAKLELVPPSSSEVDENLQRPETEQVVGETRVKVSVPFALPTSPSCHAGRPGDIGRKK